MLFRARKCSPATTAPSGAFKDPNVYGPFLILPAMMLLERMIRQRIELSGLMFLGLILFGELLSFSRGA